MFSEQTPPDRYAEWVKQAEHLPELTDFVQGGQSAAGCGAEPAWSPGSFRTWLLHSVPGRRGAGAAASFAGASFAGHGFLLSEAQLEPNVEASQLPQLPQLPELWQTSLHGSVRCKPPCSNRTATSACLNCTHQHDLEDCNRDHCGVDCGRAVPGWQVLDTHDEGCSVRDAQ